MWLVWEIEQGIRIKAMSNLERTENLTNDFIKKGELLKVKRPGRCGIEMLVFGRVPL